MQAERIGTYNKKSRNFSSLQDVKDIYKLNLFKFWYHNYNYQITKPKCQINTK